MAERPLGRDARETVPAPPHFLDPILALAERIDRARMHLRHVRPHGLLCLQFTHHRGGEIRLRDGTVVSRGDPIAVVHLDNRVVRAMDVGAGWQREAVSRGREELRTLADWTAQQAADRRPVAYYAYSILAPFAARVGFEVHEVPMTRWRRVVNWYLRGVMARWSPAGRGRLARGRTDLHAREVWLSAAGLMQRYGSAQDG